MKCKLYSYMYCNMGMIHFDCTVYVHVMQFLVILIKCIFLQLLPINGNFIYLIAEAFYKLNVHYHLIKDYCCVMIFHFFCV